MFFLIFFLIADSISRVVTETEHDIYKGRYTRDLKGFEVVVPKKVSEDGEFLSYYLPHFYNSDRVKRGMDTDKVHYVLPLEGTDKVLELTPSEDFFAPGVVIEHHETDTRNDINSVKFRKARKQKCYYHGLVKNESRSSAAISTCLGLAGLIQIGNTHYLIEPVDDDGKPTNDGKHKHLLYKRSHQRNLSDDNVCGTTGNFKTAFKQRMEWEEKYGKSVEESMRGIEDPFANNHRGKAFEEKTLSRAERWCTTCKPYTPLKCQTAQPACEVERPLFIELLVVIGPRVATTPFLNDDTELFVNTVINMAIKHFEDSSLGRPVHIKLVRMITMGYIYPELDPRRYDPQILLHNFCEWQMHFNPNSEDHPNHHDFAIYIVKFEPCQGSLLGLTNMASMCRPDKACAVISEEGLLTGHIITHMIGHSLGADHDEPNLSGCCAEEPDGTCYHMGPRICSWASAFSTCSKQCISKFVNSHAGWCMADIPTEIDFSGPILLPGQVYSAAEQCRINFEIDTYACLVGEFCKRLYCKINEEECVSSGEPPAQGTRCGPDQWCFNGRCVHRGSRPGATNGEWGIWSHWTPCTKTCGGGIQTAHRACDSPAPSQGGRQCPGSWIKSRMCNIGPCADAGKGFLDQQCKNTNARPYHGRKHEWLFFNQQVEDVQCVVICINERHEIAVRSPLAVDGTFCKPGTKDVCIRGECKSVGCDWVIGSKAKEDACGVCHGNGTECRIMQGFFVDSNFQGLIEFLKLPIGTSMILVRETRPSPCFFVITNSLNSSYYLNHDNEDRQFFTGAFKIQGTIGIYQLKAEMERIFIKDPITVPITLSLSCHEMESTIGILYQYALPEPNNPSSSPTYNWEFLSWEKCPHPCGGAIQRSIAVCVESQGGEVEDGYCVQQPKPADKIRVCNPHSCKAKWWVGPWAQCDCYNKEGITTRMVMCAYLKEARNSYIEIVNEEQCMGDTKPLAEKSCDPQRDKEMWLKKGHSRRDLADLIPYTDDVGEMYSVFDAIPEERVPYVANVREIVYSLDPEDVNDYIYMRKTGINRLLWEKINEDCGEDVRFRRRRRRTIQITQSKETKNYSTDDSNENSDGKRKVTEFRIHDGKKRTYDDGYDKNEYRQIRKLVEEDAVEMATQALSEELDSNIVNIESSGVNEKNVSADKLTTGTVDSTTLSSKNPATETPVPKETTVSAHSVAMIPVTVQGRQIWATYGKQSEVKMSSKPGTASHSVGSVAVEGKKHNSGTALESTEVKMKGTERTMTIPQVLTDPGLTAYSLYATETPVPQRKCWQIELKKPKETSTCRPLQDAAPEPAESAPEMDFMNTSNIKIYLVPIKTTIRTIIQNDQEFVMMETLAKYPVADELNVMEHFGDAARRELKLAKDKQRYQTQKSIVAD